MGLTEFELKKIEMAVAAFMAKRRPRPEIRKQLDLGYRITRQSVEVFEIRPVWHDPSRYKEHGVAKATYVRTRGAWRVFWQRADLKWHAYEPTPQTKSIEAFLALVDKDEYGCFFG